MRTLIIAVLLFWVNMKLIAQVNLYVKVSGFYIVNNQNSMVLDVFFITNVNHISQFCKNSSPQYAVAVGNNDYKIGKILRRKSRSIKSEKRPAISYCYLKDVYIHKDKLEQCLPTNMTKSISYVHIKETNTLFQFYYHAGCYVYLHSSPPVNGDIPTKTVKNRRPRY
jgi:predicted GTPase